VLLEVVEKGRPNFIHTAHAHTPLTAGVHHCHRKRWLYCKITGFYRSHPALSSHGGEARHIGKEKGPREEKSHGPF
ncbi:hypothetical protein, partial [Rhizobium sp.]|uniref:hypothetical protein n=1 Tax=Rhizobium sp. TaxID=391 RepID=UPI0028A7E334